MLQEVKRLHMKTESAIRETVNDSGFVQNDAHKQNIEDNFTSLALDSCCISMKDLLKSLQSEHSCEAAQFPLRVPSEVHLISSFSPRRLIVVADLLLPKWNN